MALKQIILTAAALLLAAAPALAEETAGHIRTTTGQAFILRGPERVAAAVGGEIFRSDTLETGADGAVGVTFTDDTRISVGPNTRFQIEDHAFRPRSNQLSFASRLGRGTLAVVSGTIARLAPEAVQVNTPSGTLGVRGTNFVVKVDEE